jgi:AcrR family transcriptional regulator
MDTALELFAENGFHATSISQIAKKAGISKGLTYNYFISKDEILHEIIQEGYETIYSNFDINQDGTLTEEEFIYFIKQSFRITRENQKFWKLYFSVMLQPKVAKLFEEEYTEKSKPIISMLYNFAKSKGSKDPEGDVMAISAMMEGAYLFMVTASEFFPAEKLEQTIIDASFRIINNQNNKQKIKP